jgi:hypothetical protein
MKLDNDNTTLKIEKSDQLRSSVDNKLTSFCMNEHKKTIHKIDMSQYFFSNAYIYCLNFFSFILFLDKTVNSINMKTSPINYEEYTTKYVYNNK